jgi:hypothetical protein
MAGMLEIPDDLAAPLIPLAWLIGSWAGAGVGDYPTIQPFRFGQEMDFGYLPGKPYLTYQSRSFLIDGEGEIGDPLASESGFWRPQPNLEVEVVLSHPMGFAEIWIGEITERRVELRTDAVVRTASAKPYTAGHRLYGHIDGGDLGYVFEMAAMGEPMQPHLSAQLKRVV